MVKEALKNMEAQKSEHPNAPSKLKQLIDNVTSKEDERKEEEEKKDPDLLTIEDIREHLKHVEKAVVSKEQRFMSRALRALVSLRRRINSAVLRTVLNGNITNTAGYRAQLGTFLEEGMEVDASPAKPKSGRQQSAIPPLPEVEVYMHLLVLLHLIDRKKLEQAVQCSESLMQKICAHNRRTLDLLAAKCYFYHCRSHELVGKLDTVRSFLHARLRTCTLRNDFEGQAALLNLLLRNYLLYNLYDQAFKLVSKSSFPESASNNEAARHHYYLGRIKAMQLEYSAAHTHLLQAIRKAPQHSAVGFKQAVHKLAVTVELLLGDIPERSIFRQPSLRKTLAPYFQLTKAVLMGNLPLFNQVLEKHAPKFQAEDTFTLIIRLRHNVIKTGVRMINQSYSRIYLSDVARKLGLDSSEDAEYIVAKAIRDGVIEATIDHERGYMAARDVHDVYRTQEPMRAFHQRISFCLDIHNSSVRAMRFPPKSYNKDLESAEERREREQQELESAKEIAEDDFDGMM